MFRCERNCKEHIKENVLSIFYNYEAAVKNTLVFKKYFDGDGSRRVAKHIIEYDKVHYI